MVTLASISICPFLSLSSVSTSSSKGTNLGASPSGQPPGGGMGFLRGSEARHCFSSIHKSRVYTRERQRIDHQDCTRREYENETRTIRVQGPTLIGVELVEDDDARHRGSELCCNLLLPGKICDVNPFMLTHGTPVGCNSHRSRLLLSSSLQAYQAPP